eukprot:6490805-Amphidinium_carterae.1
MSFVLASQATRAVHHLRPWPPFQLSSPRSYMSVSSSLVSQRAQNLCAGDAFRMHPSCYELDWLVRDSHGLRWLLPSEQLRVLAISSSYFSSLQKFVGGSILDTARSFCSVASPVPVLALLFSPHFAADPVDPYTLWARLQENELSAPTLEGSWRARFGQSPLAPSHQQSLSLIKHISRAATHRGGEVRLSADVLYNPPSMGWVTFNPHLWKWRVLQSYAWREPGQPHITYLECLALFLLLRKLSTDPTRFNFRFLHLLDSQAALGALCKGRSSSHQLNSLLRRIAAHLVLMQLSPLWGWVQTHLNPADGPSRWKPQDPSSTDRGIDSHGQSSAAQPSGPSSYIIAVERFTTYLSLLGIALPRSLLRLDACVSDFLESLWEHGDPKSFAADALSGLQHFIPSARHHLPSSWRLFRTWTRFELPQQAPPLPKLHVFALARFCRLQQWQSTMCLLLLGFHTLCRSGELFAIRKRDITINPITGQGVLFLPISKSGERSGHQESVSLRDPWLGKLLYCILRPLSSDALLSSETPACQRARLQTAVAALQLAPSIRWYSLRRGGATALYQQGAEFNHIAIRGRWANAQTVRIYIND